MPPKNLHRHVPDAAPEYRRLEASGHAKTAEIERGVSRAIERVEHIRSCVLNVEDKLRGDLDRVLGGDDHGEPDGEEEKPTSGTMELLHRQLAYLESVVIRLEQTAARASVI